MRRILTLLVVLAVTVAACGGGDDEATAPPEDTATQAGTLIGVLGGDAQLEGGCVWIEPTSGRDADVGQRVEPILPDGYRVTFEPQLQVLGPDGEVVAEGGEEVVVEGRPAPDSMSICQVGPLYQVDAFLGTVGP